MKANYAAWHIPTVDFASLQPKERLYHILRFAVLAPSAHNTQPWTFRVSTNPDTITVSLDKARLLGESDPHKRQAYLGLGAVIENICVATQAYGGETVTLNLLKKDGHVADIILSWPSTFSSPNDTVLDSIKRRMSNRSPYRSEKLKADTISVESKDLTSTTLSIVNDASTRKKIGELVAAADLSLMNKAFKYELATWVHHNWTNHHTGMPAGVQGIPGPVSLIAKKILRSAPIEKDQAKKDEKVIAQGPLLIIISGKNDDKEAWLEAGRMFERVCLGATAKGFDVAALASIVESASERKKLQELLGIDYYPLALLRIGHATKHMPRSPRLPANVVTKG
jgi:nitroreductase